MGVTIESRHEKFIRIARTYHIKLTPAAIERHRDLVAKRKRAKRVNTP